MFPAAGASAHVPLINGRSGDITVSMAKQTVKSGKRRPGSRGPLPTGKGRAVLVRIQPPQFAALEAWAKRQPDKPTVPEALRRLAEKALTCTAESGGVTG